MNTLNYQVTQLENGLRIITETVTHVKSMAIGVWVGVGSRYEAPELNGITHFIEHMLFKGTGKRSAKQIAEEIDAVGGQINAFTSKEYTCYYIKALDEDFALAADILADMIFNSILDPKEVAKECEVIIEEIKMYEDTPDDLVSDLFAETMWGDQPLGKAILGTEDTISTFTGELMREYMRAHYTAENMVISVVGNIEHQAVADQLAQLFGDVPQGEKNQFLSLPSQSARTACFQKDIGQAQICIGVPGVSSLDDAVYPISLLNSYLGGGLSSRLVQRIREEMGLAYSVYSYHGAYTDSGVFMFSAATRPENCQQVVNLILEEIEQVVLHGISEEDLKRALSQMKGSLFMGLESINSRMNKLGRSLLSQDKVITPEESIEKLSRVTVEDIQAIAEKLFKEKHFTVVILGPVQDISVARY